MMNVVDLLVLRSWWRYDPKTASWVEAVYHGFNLFEGATWVVLACLVLRRSLIHHRSKLEYAYSLVFLAFGFSDFRESTALDSWLIWLKLVNLILLMKLRDVVIRRYYPTSRLY
ncbi:hypothetical protein [Singulisphaera sp. PoT]|uniref:hypothetical protein n=1 Tax=Singulisphaera sp. PoT TaxID=3411797 RepID=UPI003BF57CAB